MRGQKVAKKRDGLLVGGALALVGGLAFFGLNGTAKIKSAFADNSQTAQATQPATEQATTTEKIELTDEIIDDDKTNNIVFIQSDNQSQKVEKQNQKNDVLILTKPTRRLTSDREELPKSTESVQVRKPEFVSKSNRANPTRFNKRKFGIDEVALQIAQTKSSSKLTTKEKLLIEAEKAGEIFDSRSITNF